MIPLPEADGDFNQIISGAAAAAEAQPRQTFESEQLNPDLGLDLEEHKLSFEISCLQHELEELKQNQKLRTEYASRIFWVVVGWLASVLVCLLLSGFGRLFCWPFKLADSVLISFLSSTTVTVVGLFVLVAKWHYPPGKQPSERKDLVSRAKALGVAKDKR